MNGATRVEIKCQHCGSWFGSPIAFGGGEVFDSTNLEGNRVKCSGCGKMTGCNKENMRAVFPDGGFTGNEAHS